jgi:selenocysteine-specific elongation factor
VRVRGIQVHGAATDQARAGERTAINLAGVATEELARGMMLSQPGTLDATRSIDVRLQLLADAKPLRHLARVHLHSFASETIAQVRLLQAKELQPGKSGLAQLRPKDPLVVIPGDRFIIRQFSPVITIGGGVVLDSFPIRHSAKKATEVAAFLDKLEGADSAEALALRIDRRGADGLTRGDAVKELGRPPASIEKDTRTLIENGRILSVGELMITKSAALTATKELLTSLEQFHKTNPLVGGISKEALRERLGLREQLFIFLVAQLAAAKKIEAQGEQLRLAGRGVTMSDEEERARKTIEQAFSSAGLKVPLLKDVLASLSIDRARSQKIMTLLLREGVLVKLGEELVFHRTALERLRQMVAAEKSKTARIDVGRFKDLAGVTRKHAIPLLEYLDRERITRRVGDIREIL